MAEWGGEWAQAEWRSRRFVARRCEPKGIAYVYRVGYS